jgi:hypothetical protein
MGCPGRSDGPFIKNAAVAIERNQVKHAKIFWQERAILQIL